ncbi:hypothetical protein GWI34_26760 [Actinomadura sp. DSM 109109]|nr:hypothetical protein [Actinomadura lepetitiana]
MRRPDLRPDGFPVGRADIDHENEVGVEAAHRIEPIVQQPALLGPPGWRWLWADFAFTVCAALSKVTATLTATSATNHTQRQTSGTA